MNIELPVKVEDVLWLPVHNATRRHRPCSVCAGHKSVWVRNIEGDEFEVRCEACGKGHDESLGCEEYYEYEPRATKFVVAEIRAVEFREGKVDIRLAAADTAPYTSYHYDVFCATEEEALAESKKSIDRLVAENMRNRQSRKQSALPEHAWSAKYHNERIKDAERQIEWHTTRLLSKKKGKSKHVAQH